jgi:hypothetical protein
VNRMDKKGFLRVVEASIAIIIIMSVLFVFYTNSREQKSLDLSERSRDVLLELSRNVSLRNDVLDYDVTLQGAPGSVEELVDLKIFEAYLETEIRVCDIDQVCGRSTVVERDVFSGERIISADLIEFKPRKVRLFIWERE